MSAHPLLKNCVWLWARPLQGTLHVLSGWEESGGGGDGGFGRPGPCSPPAAHGFKASVTELPAGGQRGWEAWFREAHLQMPGCPDASDFPLELSLHHS